MSNGSKNRQRILQKLGIEKLNPMQEEAHLAIHSCAEVLLLSPTGTGKTLAFLLPIISELDPDLSEVQTLIIVPSRELAIQIEQVIREMGTGFKTNAVYGGRSGSKDRVDIKHRPAILVGTPGRVADHIRRHAFSVRHIKTLVLDEFDKSLEVGFEKEMSEIIAALDHVEKKILTSATQGVEIPDFVEWNEPVTVNFLSEGTSKLSLKTVLSPEKDKLDTLVDTLCHLGNQPGIIFCNFKETINRVSDFLTHHDISHGTFYGGLEQKDRERALIKFRNGTHQLLLSTDLAARGIDVPEIKFIIHYHLPLKGHEFTHRNGRTARMKRDGSAYVLHWEQEKLPEYLPELGSEENPIETLISTDKPQPSSWKTLFVSGGRRDKISKGDIAGLFFHQGELKKDELGIIELKNDCAFVAVKSSRAERVVKLVSDTRLKKKKVRVTLI